MTTKEIDTVSEITSDEDYIDVREVIARFEWLEGQDLSRDEDEWGERERLDDLLDNLKSMGGDEQWRGDWYPITLIRDSYFEESARDLAEDLYGKEIGEAHWPFNCIDWERAVIELRMDYTSVEFDGITYWYR